MIPGLDFLKAGSRVGRKVLAEVAEEGLSEISKEGIEQLGKTLSKETVERAGKEAVTLSVAREEMLTRLDILANDTSLSQSTRDVIESARNSLRDHLTQEDLIGALRDNSGVPVTINGKTYDHLNEVTNGVSSLQRAKGSLLKEMNKHLLDSPEYKRLSQEIEAISETMRRINGFKEVK